MNKYNLHTITEELFTTQTVVGHCLEPLLKALNWNGTKRQFREALPHFTSLSSIPMFCKVMENLNFKWDEVSINLNKIDPRIMPCLYVTETGAAIVIINKKQNKYTIFEGSTNLEIVLTEQEINELNLKGKAYIFKPISFKEYQESLKLSWIRQLYNENKPLIYSALFLTFALNLVMLSLPLFIMSIYDRVIGTYSVDMLRQYLIGIALVISGIYLIYQTRSKLLAIFGARMDRDIGNIIFERLLYLSPGYTETATIGSQVSRLKDFDKLREFFSGPLLTIFFDLPFVILGLIVIAIVGGNLVLVPITLMIIFTFLCTILNRKTKHSAEEFSKKGAAHQDFLIESIRKIRAIKYLVIEKKWIERFRSLSADSALANLNMSLLSAINNAVSDALIILTGLAVISFGAIKVINGALSIGAIIAIMILTWRILSPIKTMFNAFPRIKQIAESALQIHRLMGIQPESQVKENLFEYQKIIRGDIKFNRVSFHYHTTSDPALLGINLHIPAGSLVGIIGPNGSGKSTLLKLLLDLYQPQSGTILLDNCDIRQFNTIDLRIHLAYLPQVPELFYGTIAQNLRLAAPSASDMEIRTAATKAGVIEDILNLPHGFNTMIKDNSSMHLSSSFKQRICYARALLKKAPILLLDEPASALDREDDEHFLKTLKSMKNERTVLMVSHRPSHLKSMDRIIVVDKGRIIRDGAPETIMPDVAKDLQ